jgi:hypothetical protein
MLMASTTTPKQNLPSFGEILLSPPPAFNDHFS